jgi:hypothetical protein
MQIIEKIFNALGYEITLRNKRKKVTASPGLPSSPAVKHKIIKNIAKEYNISSFVETGTYLGGLIYAMKDIFQRIHTIELAEELFVNAQQKFEPFPYIHTLLGDSGEVLQTLVPTLQENSIFWLDGHFSGGITARGETDAPVGKELKAIIKDIHNGFKHIILIDDARLFINDTSYTGYPRMKEIENLVQTELPNYAISIESDVIIIKY